MLALLDRAEPIVADDTEAAIASQGARMLASTAAAKVDVQLTVREDPSIIIPMPARAVEIIYELLQAMAKREPFSVIPHAAELTTQQAADYLNVSRPYLVGLIDRGEIRHRTVGRHRRVRFADLLEYEKKSAAERRQALAELAAEARALDLE
jgi:excisionase family DNA binding protein